MTCEGRKSSSEREDLHSIPANERWALTWYAQTVRTSDWRQERCEL